jgi:hypothetical protein
LICRSPFITQSSGCFFFVFSSFFYPLPLTVSTVVSPPSQSLTLYLDAALEKEWG